MIAPAAWWRRLLAGESAPLATARWVVVDCESSGLDVAADSLISIGAVAVTAGRIDLAGGFNAVLRQDAPSAAGNILIHGISGSAQTTGQDPAAVLQAFAGFAAEDAMVAFHAAFDRALIEREMRRVLGIRSRRRWLDLAQLMPAIDAEGARSRKSLDDWLDAYGIGHSQRHDALGDAFATAQLFQVALARSARQGARTVNDVLQASAGARWLA